MVDTETQSQLNLATFFTGISADVISRRIFLTLEIASLTDSGDSIGEKSLKALDEGVIVTLYIACTYVLTNRTLLVTTSFSNQFSVSDCSTTST